MTRTLQRASDPITDAFPGPRRWPRERELRRWHRQRRESGRGESAPRDDEDAPSGEELEEAADKAGIPMPLAPNIKDVLKMDAFTKSVGLMPLVSVEKVGETDPIPFTPNPKTPLDGIRQLATMHVIAGPSIGRATALHGADALNA